jgi:hypothetical protein
MRLTKSNSVLIPFSKIFSRWRKFEIMFGDMQISDKINFSRKEDTARIISTNNVEPSIGSGG